MTKCKCKCKAVSLRTIHSYLTAWRCFKAFHLSYNLPFPDFSLLAITSFISYLNSIKNLLAGSIKGYLSGVQFFHKLIYGFPSSEINNSQTSLLIRVRVPPSVASPCLFSVGRGSPSGAADPRLPSVAV